MASRISQFAVLLTAAWCIMTLTHELGHLAGGWLGGAVLVEAELRPWRLPYSLFAPDPQPLLTLWAGPILGVAVPLLAAAGIRRRTAWFIAHFCLLANGLYLAVGWWEGSSELDATKLLDQGASAAQLWSYSIVTIAWGYTGLRADVVAHFHPSRHD